MTANQAVSQLKHLKRTTGEVADCTDQELQETVIDIGASFDCSWSSRGWSALFQRIQEKYWTWCTSRGSAKNAKKWRRNKLQEN